MSSSSNGKQYPMILIRSEDDVDLIIKYLDQGWAEKVTLSRPAWEMIAPIAWHECREKLLDLQAVEDGVPIEFEDDDHVQSLMWLATLARKMSPASRLVRLAECWVGLPLSGRANFWRDGTGDKPVHAQLLGTRSDGGHRLELKVPEWLPKLVKATRDKGVMALRHRIHWSWVVSPLGTSCIAWCNGSHDSTVGYLAISSCPVAFAPAHDLDRRMARNAIEMLSVARDAIAADGEWQRVLKWLPTGHELFEIEATLEDWRRRLS